MKKEQTDNDRIRILAELLGEEKAKVQEMPEENSEEMMDKNEVADNCAPEDVCDEEDEEDNFKPKRKGLFGKKA